jgi:hypothetical protein
MPEAGLFFGTTLACVLRHLIGLYKLRNLKVAATRPNVPFGTGGHKSLNSGNKYLF